MSNVLVTGGCGAIGSRLVGRLVAAGHGVRILDRTAATAQLRDVEVITADLGDRAAVARATRDVEIVFHLAAVVHVTDPTPQLLERYESVNVDGTRNVVEAARSARVGRVVFFSTINVYGPTREGETHDEGSPLVPDSRYAQTKAIAERVTLETVPGVVLRLAAVYGPGMKGNYLRLLRALQRRRFVLVGTGRNRRTLVHVDDVCAAALLVASHRDALGRVYNVTDGAIHSVREIVLAICAAIDRHPPRFRLPVGPVRAAAWLVDRAWRLAGRTPPVGPDAIGKLLEDVAVSGQRITRELGYAPAFDLETGWKATVDELSSGPLTLACSKPR
jgi:nucleoside-diphosphate-sugar epimerase